MMYANLVDLDDFIAKLAELGIQIAPRSEWQQVRETLSGWLASANRQQLAAFDNASRELAEHAEVLPQVAALMRR